MKFKFEHVTTVTQSDLEQMLHDYAHNSSEGEFNKTAIYIVEMLLGHSGDIGTDESLLVMIEKFTKKWRKTYHYETLPN